jgi:hypothetical protein
VCRVVLKKGAVAVRFFSVDEYRHWWYVVSFFWYFMGGCINAALSKMVSNFVMFLVNFSGVQRACRGLGPIMWGFVSHVGFHMYYMCGASSLFDFV